MELLIQKKSEIFEIFEIFRSITDITVQFTSYSAKFRKRTERTVKLLIKTNSNIIGLSVMKKLTNS